MHDIKDAIDFVREIVRDALRDVAYYERELGEANIRLEYAKTFIKHNNFDLDAERAEYDDDDDVRMYKNVTQLALKYYDDAVENVEYHSKQLAIAYRAVAFAKTLLMRGNYTEIDIAEIQKAVDAAMRE